MKPGEVTETIEVTAAAPVLQSQDASVGQVVDSRSVNDLPLNGRNFTFLAQLGAGSTRHRPTRAATLPAAPFRPTEIGPPRTITFLMASTTTPTRSTSSMAPITSFCLPVDAIQEFKVQTSDFSAEFGRSGAAVLNATIKSGTNEFHGDVWEFFRNDKLDAADFFENSHGVPKGELRQNQFGFTAGGPVYIPKVFNGQNKVFIFGDYQGFRRVQGTILSGSVPSMAERSSGYTNFQDLIMAQTGAQTDGECTILPAAGMTCPAADQRSFATGTVFDPATTRAITAGQIDPVTGLYATSTGFARDPFGCAATLTSYTLSAVRR